MCTCLRIFLFLCWTIALQALPPGFRYEYLIRTVPHNGILNNSIVIHILEINPTQVRIVPVHAGKEVLALETVSSLAKRYQATAAINGGFFRSQPPYQGTSAGVLRIGGQWYSSPRFDRGAIGWKQSEDLQVCETAIDRIALDMKLFIGGQALPIDGINQPPTTRSAILYTPQFHPTTLTSSSFSELAIDADGACHQQAGPTPIPQNGYVYSLAPLASPFMPFLSSDARARVQIGVQTLNHPDDGNMWSSFPNIVGGSPVLISDGKAVKDFTSEHLPDAFSKERRPRTAVGINREGHWLVVVVDGNNHENSIGMDIEELVHFMLELGCVHALNLDGGGSSTFVIEGNYVNAPGGVISKNPEDLLGIEKHVSDAILFFAKEPSDHLPSKKES